MALKKIQYDVRLLSTEKTLQGKAPIVYTNDLNSAEFVFNILDMTPEQLAGATATTLLYMRDGSFFQNSDVNLNGNTFTYLLKENEGNHGGLAQIQLVVKIGTIEYATQLYNFEVVSGLETKVAVEVMIQDWTTLTRDAKAYIDQFNTRAENLLSGLENGSVKSNSKNVKPMKQMILFYGNPIEINDTMTVEKSARIYSKYDIVVFNGNIEEPNHSYHNNTKLIVARVKELNPTIEIFGYIHSHDPVLRDTGSSQPFLTIPEVDAKCKKWRDLIGATGIFLDAFGYDYWVTRTRQNELLDTVHANGMNAITNSWMVDYVFSKKNYSFNNGLVQTNPNNVQIKLGENDYYLFENHIYRRAYYTDGIQEANDSDRVHQAIYYHSEPQAEYDGKSYYEHFGTKTISLNGLQEPNIRFFNEAYLTALATGCDVFSMSGAGWSNKNYPHFEPPMLNADHGDVDISEFNYVESKSELYVKTKVGLHEVEIQYNQPDEVKNIYEFPNTPFVFKIGLSGTLNVNSSIQIVLNGLLYYPAGVSGDTATVLATKIASFDYGTDWIVSVVDGTTVRFEFKGGVNPAKSGKGSNGGNYMYLNTSKGIVYSYDIESLAFKVIRRITLDGKFLHSESGISVLRPYLPNIGTQYFDETLNIPIWFNGTNWVNINGTIV